jgi:hypothetical protein
MPKTKKDWVEEVVKNFFLGLLFIPIFPFIIIAFIGKSIVKFFEW